ncbi:hypothetical protein QAD02_005392 [Eretmocerus hayati]|uniref:Uncharacterized protein n=1 Tax=Eretmocerus hayati TaxID=131215 RepID=A0ACC2NX56_9HYME|nr:hypothetical protein QAD02_005392 [Eretmocerus hayati]
MQCTQEHALSFPPGNAEPTGPIDSDLMDFQSEPELQQDGFSQFASSNPFNFLQDHSTANSDNLNARSGTPINMLISKSPPPKRQRDGSVKSQYLENTHLSRKQADPLNAPLPSDGEDDSDTRSRIEADPKSSSPADNQRSRLQRSDPAPADVNKSSTPKQQEILEPLFYSQGNSGPYIVFIEPIDASQVKGKLNPTSVGIVIAKKIDYNRYACRSSGKQKVTITASDPEAANAILRDTTLALHNLRATAPVHRLSRQGIIRDVPLDLSDGTILHAFQYSVPVIKVKRLSRSKTEASNQKSFIPTQSIQVTFDGQHLPSRVRLYGASHPVEPFSQPVRMCFNCFRYGQIQAQCRSSPICAKCGAAKHDSADACPQKDADPICVNCQGNHDPVNKICPEYQLQRDARTLAAQDDIPVREAYARLIRDSPPNTRS